VAYDGKVYAESSILMASIWCNGIVSARDKKPYVQIMFEGKMVQLSMTDTRQFATDLMQSAGRAEADAILFRFFEKLEMKDALGFLMQEFRDFRHELDEDKAERPNEPPSLMPDPES
jgi:hypothetical protein